VNQARDPRFNAVPMPVFALDVQRAGMPGQPGANFSDESPICETDI
jgi:hypothetical protein